MKTMQLLLIIVCLCGLSACDENQLDANNEGDVFSSGEAMGSVSCPCDVNPGAICSPSSTGTCNYLPRLNQHSVSTQLAAFETEAFPIGCGRTGSLEDAGIQIHAGDRDEVVPEGSRGTFGNLTVGSTKEACWSSQRFRDGEIGVGTIFSDFYYVDNLSPAEGAACKQVIHTLCAGTASP